MFKNIWTKRQEIANEVAASAAMVAGGTATAGVVAVAAKVAGAEIDNDTAIAAGAIVGGVVGGVKIILFGMWGFYDEN